MRALIFDGTSIRLDQRAAHPTPGAAEALVRLSQAAISRADLAPCKSAMRPGVPGHQFVGVVESVDGRAPNLIGKRVVGSPVSFCGKCELCLAGLSRHCRNRKILGRDVGGCLAERFTIPLSSLALVPDNVDDDAAVFAVELAAACQAAGQLTIVGKPYITVLGNDSLALLTAQVMAKLNASVRLLGEDEASFSLCEKWGIKHRSTSETGRRADQDIVVECTGTAAGFELAMQLVRPRGKILLKSLFESDALSAIDLNPVILHEVEVIGSFQGSMTEAIAMLARREIDVISLVGRRVRLSDAAGGLWASEVLKVLVEP